MFDFQTDSRVFFDFSFSLHFQLFPWSIKQHQHCPSALWWAKGSCGCQVPQQEAGVPCPQAQDFGISILGQTLFPMKRPCPGAAGSEGLLLTPVPAATQLSAMAMQEESGAAFSRLLPALRQELPPAAAGPPRPQGCKVRARPAGL